MCACRRCCSPVRRPHRSSSTTSNHRSASSLRHQRSSNTAAPRSSHHTGSDRSLQRGRTPKLPRRLGRSSGVATTQLHDDTCWTYRKRELRPAAALPSGLSYHCCSCFQHCFHRLHWSGTSRGKASGGSPLSCFYAINLHSCT